MTKRQMKKLSINIKGVTICGIRTTFTQDSKDKDRYHVRFKVRNRDELREMTNALKLGITYRYIMKEQSEGCDTCIGYEGHATTAGDTLIRRFWHDQGWIDHPYKPTVIVEEFIPNYSDEG